MEGQTVPGDTPGNRTNEVRNIAATTAPSDLHATKQRVQRDETKPERGYASAGYTRSHGGIFPRQLSIVDNRNADAHATHPRTGQTQIFPSDQSPAAVKPVLSKSAAVHSIHPLELRQDQATQALPMAQAGTNWKHVPEVPHCQNVSFYSEGLVRVRAILDRSCRSSRKRKRRQRALERHKSGDAKHKRRDTGNKRPSLRTLRSWRCS